jgi:hypothetical protein
VLSAAVLVLSAAVLVLSAAVLVLSAAVLVLSAAVLVLELTLQNEEQANQRDSVQTGLDCIGVCAMVFDSRISSTSTSTSTSTRMRMVEAVLARKSRSK